MLPRLILLLCAVMLLSPSSARAETLTVFAAASTGAAVAEAAALFEARSGHRLITSFAASSTLAKQIDHGAPADLYLSASHEWMDYLERRGHLARNSRVDLLANRLVIVAPADSDLDLAVAPGFPLAESLDGGRLAVGDPDHVPAGIYARGALQSLGVWAELAPRLARSSDVRAALALVARGETPAGIVYASDATLTPAVRVVATFPPEAHPPIVYPAALVAGEDGPAARSLLAFLRGPEAREIFRRHGFRPLAGEAAGS